MLKLQERRQPKPPAPREPDGLEYTGRIITWKPDKGFGFVHTGDRRVFLHYREFAERHKRPEVGDQIRFTLGTDARNRPCAQNAIHLNDGGRITPLDIILLCGLLALPIYSLTRAGAELRWISAYLVGIGAITYWRYAVDKQKARAKTWRISETTLHFFELIGGWPAAWLAQKRLRHKCSKSSYQFTFRLIILIWQFLAFDSLQDWNWLRQILAWIERTH